MTAGHKRKHNECRTEVRGCVSGYTYISRVKSPESVYQECVSMYFEECNQAQADARPRFRHKADRLVTGALELLLLAVCSCLRPWSVREK